MDTRYLLYRNTQPLPFVHLLVFCPLLPKQRARSFIFANKKQEDGISPVPLFLIHYAFSTSSRTNIIRKLTASKMHETQMPFSANCFVSTLPRPAPTANTPITAK